MFFQMHPAFERITSTTIIEKKEVGFSGLLVILENSVRNLAEKQANMTSGMNHSYFNVADSAVGNDAYNHDEEIFLADSRNESNLSNCSLSLQSTPPDTKNYHLYLNTLTPVSPTLVADRYLGPSATTTPSITSNITNTITYIFGLYGTIFLMILTANLCTYSVHTKKYCYWNMQLVNKLYIRRPIYRNIACCIRYDTIEELVLYGCSCGG